nr:MAG TPA: hypothetical protein [Caudoviricetes sp.]
MPTAVRRRVVTAMMVPIRRWSFFDFFSIS